MERKAQDYEFEALLTTEDRFLLNCTSKFESQFFYPEVQVSKNTTNTVDDTSV